MAVFFMSQVVSAQTSEWKEKTEFHKIMSHTFHSAEEGNFAPIKSRIDEMETKAVAFKNSEIPADFGNSLVKSIFASNKEPMVPISVQ